MAPVILDPAKYRRNGDDPFLALQRRLQNLEDMLSLFGVNGDSVGLSDSGGGDFFSPGVGQIIKPDGTVEYDFEGRIKATGLTLEEYLGAEAEPPANQVIGYEDTTTGNVNEKIWAQMSGAQATSTLYAIANQNKKRSNGEVVLNAYDENGALVFLNAQSKKASPNERRILCGAGPTASQRTIVNANQASSFLQVVKPDTVPKNLRVNIGLTECEFTVKGNASATKTVPHELGGVEGALLAGGWSPLTSSCFIEAQPEGLSNIQLRARFPFGELAIGTKVVVRWIAIGN